MTATEFAEKLAALDAEGTEVITAAKAQSETSTALQAELNQGIEVLRNHYGQKIQSLIEQFVSQVPE